MRNGLIFGYVLLMILALTLRYGGAGRNGDQERGIPT
jgi:hypothetical protein